MVHVAPLPAYARIERKEYHQSRFCFVNSLFRNILVSSHKTTGDVAGDNPAGDATQILVSWGRGDQSALDRLVPLVYRELRRLAASYLRRERSDHTLQPTALVHEAYLRLVDQSAVECRNRAQFFAIAANLMRQILV